jgi:hypothetical protein
VSSVPPDRSRTRTAQTLRKGGAKRKQVRQKGKSGKDVNSGSSEDGSAVVEQLRKYFNGAAPSEYVGQTVVRLNALAMERRFKAYRKLLPAHTWKETEPSVLRNEWTAAVPFRLREKFDGLASEWNMANSNHTARLTQFMLQWIIADKEPQTEVEDRLRFFRITPTLGESKPEVKGGQGGLPGRGARGELVGDGSALVGAGESARPKPQDCHPYQQVEGADSG